MSGNSIHFGTSGWRAVIGEEFTFANVRRVTSAIALHVCSKTKSPTLLVGRDTRFFSEEFARTAAAVLRAHGVRALVANGATPTPVLAYEVRRRKTDGAINFTASHNPAEYHGVKFSGADGAPARPEVTREIEARVARSASHPFPAPQETHDIFETIDLHGPYFERLAELVNFSAIRAARLKLICDPVYGCGAGYLDRALADHEVEVTTIRANRDVLFGGHGPDVSAEHLEPLRLAVLERGAQLGLATDGDADRFGILDADGSWVSPNHVLALLFDYLLETRAWKLGVARSVATTHLLDALAKHHNLPVYETPVGFKYIAEFVLEDKLALGGEESAGLTIRGHVPEKDGILACLLVAEMLAARRASLAEQLRALFRKVGTEFWPIRENLHVPDEIRTRVLARLQKNLREFLGRRVKQIERLDGTKMIFEDGAWILMRLSGTEPLLRLYAEADSPERSRRLAENARQWIFE
jgi:alpha-D-glucose phosphate-specific phosphoglucomutase